MDQELEQKVKECNSCQMLQKSPAQTPMHPWEWPNIHGHDYISITLALSWVVTVDAHCKWIEADIVNSATSTRQMFATHGIPETIVSNNGSVFISREFQQFAKLNGIKHSTISPCFQWAC